MKKIKKILLATDFSKASQNAYEHALLLADQSKASLALIHVVFPQSEGMDLPVMVAGATQVQIDAAREVIKAFNKSGIQHVQDKIESIPLVENYIEVGSPTNVINRAISENEFDLVILGSKTKHNIFENVLGSVSSGMVKRSACPVLVIPEKAPPKQIMNLAYATDLNAADPYEIWKTMRFLDHVHAILRVVHVNTGDSQFDEKEDLKDMRAFFAEHSPSLQILFHQLPGKSIETELADFNSTYDIDLLIMFQPKRSWFANFFHKSRTSSMTSRANVPVLVMKE